MAVGFIDSSSILFPFRAFGSLFFGGKDQYTQTQFPNAFHTQFMVKGEQWLEVDDKNKFKIYNTSPHLKAVIDRKAMMKANGQWCHFRMVKDKTGRMVREKVENSKFVKKLDHPNFLQDGTAFGLQSSILQGVYGNNIIYAPKGPSGLPMTMFNLPTPFISIERTGKLFKQIEISGVIEKYILNNLHNGNKEDYDPKDIVHFKDPHPLDPVIGLSKLEALMMAISNMRLSYGFRNRIMSSNAMLGILSSETPGANGMAATPLDTAQQLLISEGMGRSFGMQDGKADILQTEASVKWQPMSYPTKQLMLFEEIDEDFKLVIDTYGLNVNIFSISKSSTYENLRNGIILAYEDTIIPEGKAEGLKWTQYFGLDGQTEWIERNYDHLTILDLDDSETVKNRADAAAILLGAGVPIERVAEVTGLDLGTILTIVPQGPPNQNP